MLHITSESQFKNRASSVPLSEFPAQRRFVFIFKSGRLQSAWTDTMNKSGAKGYRSDFLTFEPRENKAGGRRGDVWEQNPVHALLMRGDGCETHSLITSRLIWFCCVCCLLGCLSRSQHQCTILQQKKRQRKGGQTLCAMRKKRLHSWVKTKQRRCCRYVCILLRMFGKPHWGFFRRPLLCSQTRQHYLYMLCFWLYSQQTIKLQLLK